MSLLKLHSETKSHNHFVTIDNDPSLTSHHTVVILLGPINDVNDLNYIYLVRVDLVSYPRHTLVFFWLDLHLCRRRKLLSNDKQQAAHGNPWKMQHLYLTLCIRVASPTFSRIPFCLGADAFWLSMAMLYPDENPRLCKRRRPIIHQYIRTEVEILAFELPLVTYMWMSEKLVYQALYHAKAMQLVLDRRKATRSRWYRDGW